MEPRLGLFGEPASAVIPCGDFEIEALKIPALVLVLDAKIRDRNFVVHHMQVIFVGNADALISRILMGIDLREFLVQFPLDLVVEDDATNPAARGLNFIGHFVVEAVEVSIVADFFRLRQAVIYRLALRNSILASEKLVGVACDDKHIL